MEPAESTASSGSPTSQALRGTGNRGNDNGNGGEHQVGIVRRELPLDSLVLSLAPPMFPDDLNIVPPPPSSPPSPPSSPPARPAPAAVVAVVAPNRAGLGGRQQPRNPLWSPVIPPPYPWATDRRATVHSLEYLLSKGMYTISGDLICKRCKAISTINYDLLSKFDEVKEFIINNRDDMHDRAPDRWNNPPLPICGTCDYPNAMKPVIGKKRNINWLFLLLGQMLGCCGITQLKFFCKHTNNHRTGAKNRLLFLTYLALCKQLQDIPIFQYHNNN